MQRYRRVLLEVERGAALDQAMVRDGRHEYAVQRRDQSGLLRMQRRAVVDGRECRLSDTALSRSGRL